MSEEIEKRFNEVFGVSLVERIYTKLGYKCLGDFLFQFTLFMLGLILFGYLLIGIPQEAVQYEAYKPYIDQIKNCSSSRVTIVCETFGLKTINVG